MTCPTCGALPGSPCTTPTGRLSRRPHVARGDLQAPDRGTIPASDYAAVWDQLTPIQADAVRATAARLLRDPAELAVELFPLLHMESERPVATSLEARTVSMDFTLTPEATAAAWSLLGHTDQGFRVYARSAVPTDSAVNDILTATTEQEQSA